MVAFATIFLGLVLGPQVVQVVVDGPVATLEIRLDGETKATRTEPPWDFVIDFGLGYQPHVLEAVAFDPDGEELSRAEQWLNVPRPEVEGEIVLSGGRDGTGVVAQVLWESRLGAMPDEVVATLDGRPLPVSDPERIEIPPHDPDRLHLLQVELRFRQGYSTLVDKTFGGSYADEVDTQLTAVPIELSRDDRTPTVDMLQGKVVGAAGRPLEVVAVDAGPAELIVVRDVAAQSVLDELGARRGIAPNKAKERHSGTLRKNQLVRFLYPVTIERLGHRTRQEQFPTSHAYTPRYGGLAWLMIQERQPFTGRQRLTEAVAVAGMAAARRNRRRAVLLVLSGDPSDASRIPPETTRRYLEHLRVPLEVWAVGDKRTTGPWGPQRPIPGIYALHNATRDLARLLERQRIVWLRGRHLPQQIDLVEQARYRLAQ